MSDVRKTENPRFIEPEKLSNLRTKQEIELMNGRPWTRQLPPPPVLPPYGPLGKISGRLEAFSYESFREYFDVKAYRTSTLPTISDGQRAGAAAAAIAAGSPGGGALIMAESDSANSSAEYIQGVINGKPFRGWVGVTRVQVGDVEKWPWNGSMTITKFMPWSFLKRELYRCAPNVTWGISRMRCGE